ncbi:secreted RxLR effector protein 161-like [Phoenix dactylifera]|uniref:Secreted RxLR effector protein 161-like n=1 Tax=Phoenix dactylifera TaxID=42345 RepID=A0A8B8ZTW2_PHODC|nr:secreted RxLR effector protein 161-like [Phoenix dactylifera]
MANSGKEHCQALKWIFRYLQGTRKLGLTFEQQDGHGRNSNALREFSGPLEGFVDANFAGDLDTRRSTTGYVFNIFSGPISWRSTLQPITALSTTEAEYIGITEAVKEALWLKRLI